MKSRLPWPSRSRRSRSPPGATAAARTTITMSGSTSVAPLAAQLAKAYVKTHPGRVKFKLAAGRLGHRRRRRRRRPRDDRQLLARPEADRPGRHRLQQDRPGRDLRRHEPGEPGRRTSTRRRSRRSSRGKVRDWSEVPGSTASGPIDLVGPHRGLGHAGRVPEDLHGQSRRSPRARPRRPPTASSQQTVQSRPERDRLRLAGLHQGLTRRAYKGVAVHPAQREVRPVRRRPQLLDGHPRRADGRGAEVHPLGPEQRKAAQQIIATHWVPLAVDWRTGCTAATSRPGATGAPSACSARCASLVLLLIAAWSSSSFAKAWPSFAHNGLAWFGAGGNVDQQLDRHLQLAGQPGEVRVHAARLAAARTARLLIDGRRGGASGSVFALFAAIFIVEFAPERLRARARAGRAAARRGPVGHLRPDRDPRARPVRRQPPDHRRGRKESVAYVVQLDGSEPARRRS